MNKTGLPNPEELLVEAKQKQLRVYEVKIEVQMPAVLTYRITSESPEEALERALRMQPNGVKYNLARKQNLKATITEAGSSLIKLVKNLKNAW